MRVGRVCVRVVMYTRGSVRVIFGYGRGLIMFGRVFIGGISVWSSRCCFGVMFENEFGRWVDWNETNFSHNFINHFYLCSSLIFHNSYILFQHPPPPQP